MRERVRRYAIIFGVVLIAVLSNVAQSAIVDGSFDCNFPGDPHMYRHEWSFDYGQAELTVVETFEELSPDVGEFSGETDSDSTTFAVAKSITNDTSATWTAYTLTLYDPTGEASFVEGSAGAAGSKFQTVTYPDATTIEFSGDDPVLDGHIVHLQLDIMIPTAGTFELTLTQSPVPEPGTIALLSFGTLFLVRRRKK